jgi:hypothetical protein
MRLGEMVEGVTFEFLMEGKLVRVLVVSTALEAAGAAADPASWLRFAEEHRATLEARAKIEFQRRGVGPIILRSI